MSKIKFKGIMPALITPFDENEKLIAPTVEKLINYEYSKGVDGFYVGGNTGEGPVLPIKTRMELCEAAVDANKGRGNIILQIGGPNFSDVKALVKHANTTNVNALSAIAPNAYYAHSDTEIVDYYKTIASLTDKPLIIYVTDLMLGNNLQKVFTELMSVENIIGLKFTQSNYYLMSLLKMINGGDINIINGPDEMLISGLAMGADGGIGSTYNIMPDRFASLYKAFHEGRIDDARKIQYSINKVIRVLIDFGKGGASVIKNLKRTLEMMGFDTGVCEFPSSKYSLEDMKALKKALNDAGYEI